MKKLFVLITVLALSLSLLSGCGTGNSKLDPDDPVTLTMWHVYGEQADSPMNRLIAEFNETVGLEKGIVIDVTLMSNGSQIGTKLVNAQAGRPGEPDMPDLFFAHTNNAAALGPENLIDWNDFFTDEEMKNYVPEFVSEGVIDDRLSVFPVSKSTHLLFINGSQFDRFSADTGITYDSLASWDGFFEAAAAFYEWSGGRTFCALDYPVRAAELNMLSQGQEIKMTDGWYDFSDENLKNSWMQLARSLVQGHICVSDLYANTQVMTGEVVSGISSSAAILYYNDMVTYPDNTTEPMDLRVLPMPQAQGGKSTVTQAGVGLCAYNTTEQKAEAASVFAHWLTEAERNLDFVAETGYMPVNNGAFDAIEDYEFIDESYDRLYSTLKTVKESSDAVTEPSFAGYYDKIYTFYDSLRSLQPQYEQRCINGESPDALAEETWELFSSVK